MFVAGAFVSLVCGRCLAAQARPLDPPRRCGRASEPVLAADTTIDLAEGKPPSWLRADVADGPRYPVAQRNARSPGEVRVSYVIDMTGAIVRGTAAVVAQSDPAFGQSVCEFLQRARFAPVELDGHRRTVRVLNQRFLFETR